jgi:hypothetical protein
LPRGDNQHSVSRVDDDEIVSTDDCDKAAAARLDGAPAAREDKRVAVSDIPGCVGLASRGSSVMKIGPGAEVRPCERRLDDSESLGALENQGLHGSRGYGRIHTFRGRLVARRLRRDHTRD